MKAAIYTRISRDRTGEQAGVTRQLEDCQALAVTLDWTIVQTFSDNDTSATSGKPRPEYERLLTAIEAGEVEAIIAWHTDRLYRQMSDLERLITVADKAGAEIKTCRAGSLDLSTPTGRMLARILGAVAKQEGEAKADRWLRSIRQRRENGQAPGWGRRLFGYTRTSEIIPHEADAIRWAAAEIIDGASLHAIAKGLSERAPTTAGNDWSLAAVRKLMSNPRLAGHSVLNEAIVGVGDWEPILPDETFRQVEAALKVKRGTGPGPRVALLAGLAHCQECGSVMVTARGNKPRNGEGQRQRVYRCSNGVHVSINAEPLEEMVEEYAQVRASDPRLRAKMDELATTTGENTAEIISLEDRLRELEKELDDPGIPIEAVKRSISRTQDRIDTLRSQVATAVPLPKIDTWPADLARRHRAVRAVVAGVIVGPRIPGVSTKVWQEDRVRIVPR